MKASEFVSQFNAAMLERLMTTEVRLFFDWCGEIRILKDKPGGEGLHTFCPITFLHNENSEEYLEIHEWPLAAEKLELEYKDAKKIVAGADHYVGQSKWQLEANCLRAQMLEGIEGV